MFLSRIHVDPRCREARRDLSDPYQLHSTLCRAMSLPERKCPGGQFLWRLEPEVNSTGSPRILVQSRSTPNWDGIGIKGWIKVADPPIDLKKRLNLGSLKAGRRFRFRLRANPCVTRNGRRFGLLKVGEQENWIARKGHSNGFVLPQTASFDLLESSHNRVDVSISQEKMLQGNQHSGNKIQIFSVLYDGMLEITEPVKFRDALQSGIGHGKVMGLGLLSVAPIG